MAFPWKLFFTVIITALASVLLDSSNNILLSRMSILAAFIGGMVFMDMVYKQDAVSEKAE